MNPTDKPTPTAENLDDARTLARDMLDRPAMLGTIVGLDLAVISPRAR